MARSSRTAIAAILVFLYCLVNVIWLFAAFVTQSELLENAGYGAVALGLIMFTIGLVSAYGIWHNQRWGKIIAIIVLTLNALSALPGILFTPNMVERLSPILAVLVAIVVVVLLLWPTPQNSTT